MSASASFQCPSCGVKATVTVRTGKNGGHASIAEWVKADKVKRTQEGLYIALCWQCDWKKKGYL